MNVDDPYAHVMMDAVDQKVADLHTYSMSDKTADLYAFDSRFTGKSSAFKVTYEGKPTSSRRDWQAVSISIIH